MKLSFLIAASAALCVAGAAIAQPPPPGAGAVRQACMPDFQKFCPDARPGPGGGIRECIVAHRADFTQPCQAALAARMQQRQQQQQNGNAAPPPQ